MGWSATAPRCPGCCPRWTAPLPLAEQAQADPALARQAASALYHLTSAAAMAWEAAGSATPTAPLLARLVLRHRVLPRDPLARTPEEDVPPSLLPDPGSLAA